MLDLPHRRIAVHSNRADEPDDRRLPSSALGRFSHVCSVGVGEHVFEPDEKLFVPGLDDRYVLFLS